MSEGSAILFAGIISAIVSIISVAVSVVTVAISNRLSSDAKTKEIKLSNYHKDRIDAVKTLYGLVVELNFANISLFSTHNKEWGHEDYKSVLNRWLLAFGNTSFYYNKNRILLLEKSGLSAQVRANLSKLSVIRDALRAEYNDLSELEDIFVGQLGYHYIDEQGEQAEINERINTLRGNPNLNSVVSSFETIRTDLEDYFTELVS